MYSKMLWPVLNRRVLLVLALTVLSLGAIQRPAVAGDAPGWLGVEVQAMTEELARAFGLSHAKGVVVTFFRM